MLDRVYANFQPAVCGFSVCDRCTWIFTHSHTGLINVHVGRLHYLNCLDQKFQQEYVKLSFIMMWFHWLKHILCRTSVRLTGDNFTALKLMWGNQNISLLLLLV